MGRFYLRNVAGKTWLIDTEYRLGSYREPLCMNETGAGICQMLLKGLPVEEIASNISKESGEDYETVMKDVSSFVDVIGSYTTELRGVSE